MKVTVLLKKYFSMSLCLGIIFLSSFFASIIQTGFGSVDIELKELKTDDGQTLVYDLYKPKLANSSDKVPFVVVVPGFQRSKEALSNIAIELSRRGFAIALIDPYAQGMSSSSLSISPGPTAFKASTSATVNVGLVVTIVPLTVIVEGPQL